MRRLLRFLALPRGEQFCVAAAIVGVWGYRLALAVMPYRHVERLSLRLGRRLPILPPLSAERVSWCARAGGETLRSVRPCLPCALAARMVLGWYGHSGELHLGVTREQGVLHAHAWVTCNGRVSIGDGAGSHVRLQHPVPAPQ